MEKHGHGGDIKAFAEEIECKIEEIIDLSSNINFVKPTLDIDFNTLNISAYPTYNELNNSIAQLYKIPTKQLELFNGATTAIYALFRHLKLSYATLYSPCYLEYKKALTLYGYKIEHINRLERINPTVKKESLVIFVNPSTPDGKFYPLEKLMEMWIEQEATIIIDESFLDFTPFQSATEYLNYPKLYILKSMTKFYSSAGIRIGAIISNSHNINKLKRDEPLWKISQFDSHYLQSALRDEKFKENSHTINRENRAYLIEILKNSSSIKKVYNSSANFILVQLKEMDAQSFQEHLKPYKIMIRNCENFDFLDDSFVRIAIKDKSSLQLLASILQ